MLIKRYDDNPILKPKSNHLWESRAVFNGCPVRNKDGISLLYRALSLPYYSVLAGTTLPVSSIGIARSEDGLHFSRRRRFITPEFSWERFGCEDPRVTRYNNKYYIFYTALSSWPPTADGIKVGLVTSGLYEKAWPEIVSAFRTMDMGDPLDFYDAIITAGHALRKGQSGTLGELAPKPHPWLYSETARIGLEMSATKNIRVIGLEDSAAGVLSIRLAGFAALGIAGGNIGQSGMKPLLSGYFENLMDALPIILGIPNTLLG